MDWQPISSAPELTWLRTKREGEAGGNICFCRTWPDGEKEWVDRSGSYTIHVPGTPPETIQVAP